MKLTYFGIYGRAEPIRILFDHANVKFEDNRIGFPDMAELKKSGYLEFGQVPALEWKDGTVMTQSVSILRALGMEYGYYPTDPLQMWLCDSTLDALYDVAPKAAQIFFAPSDAGKAEALKEFLEVHLPSLLKIMNTRLNGKVYFTGKMSIADIAFGAFLAQTACNPASPHQKAFEGVMKQFKNVEAFWANFAKDHAAHLKNRPAAFF